MSKRLGARSSFAPLARAALTTALLAAPLTGASLPSAQASSFLQGFGNSSGISPFQSWQTIHTAHFKIHHPDSLRETAELAARYFEEAHAVLAPLLAWEPQSPTSVIVFDPTDSANGLTTPLERFGILIYATPPESWFSTTRNDDWLRTLVTHEYVHTLTIDPTRGVWKTLRTLFGDITLPNGTWPSWMLEGMAVYLETRLSTSGRGRSPSWEATIRAMVRDDLLGKDEALRLDQVTGSVPTFPEGEIPYLFGYHLISELAANSDTAPEAPLRNLSIRGSGGLPYLLDRSVAAEVRKDWSDLWSSWVTKSQTRHRESLAQLRKNGPITPLTYLPEIPGNPHDQIRSPRRSPDQRWTVYTAEGPSRRSGLYVIDHSSGQTHRVDDQFLGAGISFLPPSQPGGPTRYALSSRLDRRGGYRESSDLILIDLEKKTLLSITDGLRARDPDITPDGKSVIFAQTRGETVVLAQAPLLGSAEDGTLALGPTAVLYTPEKRGRVSQPRISPDGARAIFSLHPARGSSESLLETRLDQSPGAAPTRTLLSNGSYLKFPFFLSNQEVGFISDQTGVENVWTLSLTGDAKPVLRSNVETALSFPSWIPSKDPASKSVTVLATTLTARGWKLAELPLSEAPLPQAALTLPPIPLAWEKIGSNKQDTPPEFTQPHEPPAVQKVESTYSSFASLAPRSWITSLELGDGSSRFNTQINGYDALELWSYGVSPGFDFLTSQPLASAHLDWRGLGPTFRIEPSTDTFGASDDYLRDLSLEASVFHPFYFTTATWVPSFSAAATRTFHLLNSQSVGAATTVPTLELKLFATNAETSRLAVTSERGRTFETGVRASLLNVSPGAQPASYKGYLRYQENLPLGAHWVLKPSLRLSYSSRLSLDSSGTFTRVLGKSDSWLSPFSSDGLDQLSLRGYPGMTFLFRGVALSAVDLRFPLARPFRGFGVAPAYFRDFYGNVFLENASALRARGTWYQLPSAGLGITSRSTWLQGVPVELSLEFHTGFRESLGGQSQAFFKLQTGLPSL